MFRCQFCGSHIFLNQDTMVWSDLSKKTKCPYLEMADGNYKHLPYQLAAFYVRQGEFEEVLELEDGFTILRAGLMRLWFPAEQRALLNTIQLAQSGIYHDVTLEEQLANQRLEVLEMPEFIVENGCSYGNFKTLNEALAQVALINTHRQKA